MRILHQLVRFQGLVVEVRDCHGRIHRGVLEGIDPARGIFLRRSPFNRIFIPIFLIAAILLLSSRRRIF
ncbi:hypothetical protein [Rummeliibacillus pycnus]|uniref:hypothetical protein n=1 Tax=Rummeliibacillus pycnus TaxID=101070 RepID=UPI003D2E82E3